MILIKKLRLVFIVAQVYSYNILTIDGGGIKGIIPATCISHMEVFAYKYAKTEKNYVIPTYKNETTGEMIERMPMKDIFDMISGTSTGSILATGLSISTGTLNPIPFKGKHYPLPKYWGPECVKIYTSGGAAIFNPNGLATGWVVLFYFITMFFFLVIFGLLGMCIYDNPKTKKSHINTLEFLNESKEQLEGQKEEE